ncbi:MAG: isopeptide-forming domain-containing fimbrial protein, partial [Chloroflexi bacterium]
MKTHRFLLFTLIFALILTIPASLALAVPIPTVTLSGGGNVPIGSSFSVTATFDNTDAADTGYGPFIDIYLPVNGADGAGNTSLPLDGVDFVGASYLGASVTTVVQTFPDTPLGGTGPDGTTCGASETPLAHPYAVNTSHQALTVCGTPGDKLVTVQLPFGSFTPSQPPASVTLDLQLHDFADLGTPLTLYARGGFQFGDDPLDNPCCDPSRLLPASSTPSSWPGTTTVTPTLMELSKSLAAPEGETATGPNYPRTYTVTVTVPAGQTVNNVNVTDYFDDNIIITNVTNITAGGSVTSLGGGAPAYPYGPAPFSSPNNELVVNFPSVSGTASFDVEFYVPDLDASASSVINPTTGDDVTTENRVSATGSWTPTDPRDSATPITINGTCPGCPPAVTLTDKSIAIQKSSAIVVNAGNSGVTPNDVIEYTLNFQISDYFTFGDIEINDIISDGQRFDNTFPPTFTISDRVQTLAGTFTVTTVSTPTTCSAVAPNDMIVDTSQIGNDTNPATDGSTSLTFCVSQALINDGAADGILQGGYTQGNSSTPATGTITYRVVVQDQFSDTYPSGDPSVDHGDVLNNTVTISGTVRDNTTITTTVGNESDTSGVSLSISQGALTKSIYQINGAAPSGNPPEVFPGDVVTYRLQYQMPSSDFEDFNITDFLPLPVFDVADPDQVGGPGPAWVFNGTPSATAPAPGTAHPHTADTFFANCIAVGGATCLDTDSSGTGDSNVPVMTIDATSNSINFQFGDFDDPSNVDTVIDILFSVTVSTDPFADSLFLTNQAQAGEGSTNSGTATSTDIIQIELREPSLSMDKGVIATDSTVLAPLFTPAQRGPGSMTINPSGNNPSWTGTVDTNGLSAAPINSDLSDVDAGDLVTFAIVLENSGGQGAFDIQVKDTLPPGFVIPSGPLGLNLQVRRGDGSNLSTAPVSGTAIHPSGLFDDGIEILDLPGPEPACQPASPTSGQNIIIVTYDLQVAPGVEPGELILNQAEVRNYSNQDGGQNFLDDGSGGVDPLTDDASTTILNTTLNKTSPASNAAIGETYQYTITANIPEGQMSNAQVVDNLTGLAFVQCDSITPSSGDLSTSVGGGFAGICSSPTVTNNGQTVTFDFGTLTNSNTDNATAETLTITYTVVALNTNANTNGSILDNSATLSWDTPTQSVSASAPDVTVVEPQINITKTFAPDTGDAGDSSTVTIAINNSGTSTAYDIVVSDVVPTDMTYSGGTLATTCAGATTDDSDPDASVGGLPDGLTVSIPSLANGASCNITFDVTIDGTASPTQVITNTADVTWTSQPGSPNNTTYNANGVERTGDNANPGELHDYTNSANDNYTVDNVALQKTLITSSETFTGDTQDGSPGNERPLAIGEIVTFQLAMTVPEGTSTAVFMRDTLVPGLQYVPNSTEIATVNGTNVTIQGMPTAQDMPTFIAVPDDNNGVPTDLGTVRYDSGTGLVEINLGNITNTDTNNAQAEQVIIRFDALVLNNNANNLGQIWQNNFRVEENGSTIGTSNDVGVIIVEPQLSVTKTATPDTGDAGDTISYSIVVTNANGANNTTAFDVRITDTLPAGLINMSGVTITPAGGASG